MVSEKALFELYMDHFILNWIILFVLLPFRELGER